MLLTHLDATLISRARVLFVMAEMKESEFRVAEKQSLLNESLSIFEEIHKETGDPDAQFHVPLVLVSLGQIDLEKSREVFMMADSLFAQCQEDESLLFEWISLKCLLIPQDPLQITPTEELLSRLGVITTEQEQFQLLKVEFLMAVASSSNDLGPIETAREILATLPRTLPVLSQIADLNRHALSISIPSNLSEYIQALIQQYDQLISISFGEVTQESLAEIYLDLSKYATPLSVDLARRSLSVYGPVNEIHDLEDLIQFSRYLRALKVVGDSRYVTEHQRFVQECQRANIPCEKVIEFDTEVELPL